MLSARASRDWFDADRNIQVLNFPRMRGCVKRRGIALPGFSCHLPDQLTQLLVDAVFADEQQIVVVGIDGTGAVWWGRHSCLLCLDILVRAFKRVNKNV